jgi:hypothetical protein
MNLETDPENNNQLNAVITEQNVDQKHFDDSIKIYSLIECSISEIQRSEWLNFKEVKKELLKFKHVQNESNNVYICYFKPMEFNCDFYHWIAKIILSKSFDLYSDYEYDTYELQNIDIDLTKIDNLSLKIVYKPNTAFNTSFDNTYHESDTKRKVLSIIDFDYQEMIENYEDGKTFVTFKDNFENIIYKYNLVIN